MSAVDTKVLSFLLSCLGRTCVNDMNDSICCNNVGGQYVAIIHHRSVLETESKVGSLHSRNCGTFGNVGGIKHAWHNMESQDRGERFQIC